MIILDESDKTDEEIINGCNLYGYALCPTCYYSELMGYWLEAKKRGLTSQVQQELQDIMEKWERHENNQGLTSRGSKE